MNKSHIIFLFLFFSNCIEVFSQSYPYRHYSVDDGLNSNTVYDIIQDRRRFIWFATSAGVCRFDGKQFRRYTVDNGLGDNEVLKIRMDNGGRLWLLQFNGTVSVIEDDNICVDSVYPVIKKLGPGFFYSNMFSDSLDNIWLYTKRERGSRIQLPDKVEFYRPDSILLFQTNKGDWKVNRQTLITPEGSQSPAYFSQQRLLLWDYYKDSLFIMVTDSGIVTVDRKNNIEIIKSDVKLPSSVVNIYYDNNEGIWVTSVKEGVYYFEKKNGEYKLFDIFLKGEYITTTLRDYEGNVWFSIHGGGVKMLPWNFKSVKSYSEENGLSDKEVYAVTVDSKKRIWFGHKYGKIDFIENNLVHSINLPSSTNNLARILKIEEHPSGYILIAGDEGLCFLNMEDPKKIINWTTFNFISQSSTIIQPVKDFFIDTSGDVYVITQEAIHSIKKADIEKSNFVSKPMDLPRKRYYSVCTDDQQQIWYSDFDGLIKMGSKGRVTFNSRYPLLGKRLVDLCFNKGKIYVSVLGYGIIVIENDSIIKHITTEQGLLSNHCVRLFLFKDKLYVSTNEGLNIVSTNRNNTFTIEQVTTADGLISNQINDVFTDDQNIYAATLKGVSVISRGSTVRKSPPQPVIYFTKVLWKGNDITQIKKPEIDYIDKYLRFDFISPLFTFPKGVTYEYNLNNEKWISTQNTSLEFNSLPPGDYTLQVRSKLKDSAWSSPIQYSFIILQPFYKTSWFYLLLFVLLISSLIFFYALRIRRIKKEQIIKLEYEHKINYLQNQALQAMVNPHFIFNSLSAIQQQINAGDSIKAGSYLSRFAKLLRKNLETINENYISLAEEIERINLYLESEKMRLEEKLQYVINMSVSLSANEILIPSMVLQPLLENAIWHGILPEGKGTLKISISNDEKSLYIKIEDNGIGINQSLKSPANNTHRKHFGLQITQERLSFLGKKLNKTVEFSISDLQETGSKGTLVFISLPLITSE